MSSNRSLEPSALSLKDLPWQIEYNNDRCTLCGQCTAVCPVHAIDLGVFRKRNLKTSVNARVGNKNSYETFYGIHQKTDVAHACIGCAMCTMACPNDAIEPRRNPGVDRLKFHVNQHGVPRRRGGRRNAPGASVLDQIKFIRISQLTDPALDAGRHEFEMRTLLGRVLPP
ncbi:MAG: 4Fe-4S binding protein, partial [Desulfobacterales bacterium]|nr:4Fe-4S binding protein [Desulfobacterales bacterium]